jgi:3-dehydroquinate dehydratase type I
LSRPKICVPVMERNVTRVVRSLRLLERHHPDFIEIRLDSMRSPSSLSEIRNATKCPLIATNRSEGQGGLFRGTEETRLETLMQAAGEKFDYIDVELRTKNVRETVRQVKRRGAGAIVSYHNQKLTHGESALESILLKEVRAGADVCKMVGTAKSYSDSLRYLRFVDKHARRTKLVCFCMGRQGIPSRILSPVFGGYFTFASIGPGRETATGQISIGELQTLYKELGLA